MTNGLPDRWRAGALRVGFTRGVFLFDSLLQIGISIDTLIDTCFNKPVDHCASPPSEAFLFLGPVAQALLPVLFSIIKSKI